MKLSYLRTFGSRVYVLDKSVSHSKFAPKGLEGVMVGYYETAKAYRIWLRVETTWEIFFFFSLNKRYY